MERVELGYLSFPKGRNPGYFGVLIGPSMIGKSTYLARSEADPVVLAKEDTVYWVRDAFDPSPLDTYQLRAAENAKLLVEFTREIQLRASTPKRREQPFIIEMCATTKTAQVLVATMACHWAGCGGETQVVTFWPRCLGSDQPDVTFKDWRFYLESRLRANPDDEEVVIALNQARDWDHDHPRFSVPWTNPLLRESGGIVTRDMSLVLQDWWHGKES